MKLFREIFIKGANDDIETAHHFLDDADFFIINT